MFVEFAFVVYHSCQFASKRFFFLTKSKDANHRESRIVASGELNSFAKTFARLFASSPYASRAQYRAFNDLPAYRSVSRDGKSIWDNIPGENIII